MLGHPIRLPATLLRRFCSTLFFVALASPAMAQTFDPDLNELEDKITEIVDASEMVGLQVALVDASGAFWARSFGYEDIERTRPLRNDSVMRAGSLSKSLTGALAQRLVEEGTIDLNMRLDEVLPELEFENRWADTHPIRLVHLAEHTTGWDDAQFSEIVDWGRDVAPLEGLSINPKSRRSRWQPGKYAAYCNTCATVLAAALVKQSGEDFDTLVRTRLLDPLRMTTSSFRKTPEVESALVPSYEDGQEVRYYHIGYRPSGALNTTATELSNFVAMLIADGRFNDGQVLTSASVARMERSETGLAGQQAGFPGGYGVGLYTRFINGHLYKGHTGAIDGFESVFAYLPESGRGYIMLMNQSDGEAFRAVRALLSQIVEDGIPKPDVPNPDPSQDLSAYHGTYSVITQRYGFSALLDGLLGAIRVSSEDGVLITNPLLGKPKRFISTGGQTFRLEDQRLPHHVFVKTDAGDLEMLQRFDTAYRRVSPVKAYAAPNIFALFLMTGLFGLISAIVWALLRPFGLFKGNRRWSIWWAPLAAFICLPVIYAAFAYGLTGRFDHIVASVGRVSPVSLTLLFATLLLPLFAIIGVWRIVIVKDVHLYTRISAASLTVSALLFSLVLWVHGWVGMSIWSYTPPMAG